MNGDRDRAEVSPVDQRVQLLVGRRLKLVNFQLLELVDEVHVELLSDVLGRSLLAGHHQDGEVNLAYHWVESFGGFEFIDHALSDILQDQVYLSEFLLHSTIYFNLF